MAQKTTGPEPIQAHWTLWRYKDDKKTTVKRNDFTMETGTLLPQSGAAEGQPCPFTRYCYFFLLEALIGFSFCFFVSTTVLTWVAILQLPFFHFMTGSGATVQ